MLSVSELELSFIDAAREEEEAHRSDNWRRQRAATWKLAKVAEQLWSCGLPGRHAILALLKHPEVFVRINAAAYSLEYSPADTLPVLREMSRHKDRYAVMAEQMILRWEEGNWHIESPADHNVPPPVAPDPWRRINNSLTAGRMFVINGGAAEFADHKLAREVNSEEELLMRLASISDTDDVPPNVGDFGAATLDLLLADMPEELRVSDFDRSSLFERAAEVDVISGQSIDFYGNGLMGFKPDQRPAPLDQRLAWAYVIRPDLSNEILERAGEQLQTVILRYLDDRGY